MAVVERIEYEDVEGLRVGRFGRRINTTCTLYRLGDVVIDTGPPNQWRWVRKFIEERQPQRVLLTHHHEDHSGNGARIQRRFQTQIAAHERAVRHLRDGFPMFYYRKLVWGRPPRFAPAPLPEKSEIGSLRIHAVYAPGHSDDMVCFHLPDRGWLFAGDLYISGRPKYLRRDENPLQQIESLKRVLQLDFDVVFCAHRGVLENGREALQEKLHFLEEMRDRVRELAAKGCGVGEITRRLMGREDFMSWFTLFDFSKRNLVRAFVAADARENAANI